MPYAMLYHICFLWVTHQSLQRTDFYKTTEYTDAFIEKYHKPAVWDEICYEGDISLGWGNITAQELVRRFWEAFLRGGHAGHGETYLDENDGPVSERQAEPALRGSAAPEEGRRQPVLWWSHGGILKGDSASRIAFLKKILEETPGRGLRKTEGIFDEVVSCAVDAPQDYQIHYLGICQPKYRMLVLPEDGDFEVEIIDTWNMTITSAGNHRGATRIELPGNQYMAIRVRRV